MDSIHSPEAVKCSNCAISEEETNFLFYFIYNIVQREMVRSIKPRWTLLSIHFEVDGKPIASTHPGSFYTEE